MRTQYEQYKVVSGENRTEASWWWRRMVDDNGYFLGDWVWATRRGRLSEGRDWEIKKQLCVTVCPDGCLMVLDENSFSYSGV